MASGGYRPNSGPQKGTKYRPRVPKDGKEVKQEKKGSKKKTAGIPKDIEIEAKAENLTPLEYMLKVMNDENETDKGRRDRMAIAAAPFLHPRLGEGSGKKGEIADRAARAGKGKFKASAPPVLKVVEK